MDCARRAAFCAAVCCASSLARLVSRPAFQRAERRPPPASSSSDPRNVGGMRSAWGGCPPPAGFRRPPPWACSPAPGACGASGERSRCGFAVKVRFGVGFARVSLGAAAVGGSSSRKKRKDLCGRLKRHQRFFRVARRGGRTSSSPRWPLPHFRPFGSLPTSAALYVQRFAALWRQCLPCTCPFPASTPLPVIPLVGSSSRLFGE